MNKFVTYGLGTAAVVIVGLFLGYQFLGTPGNVGGPGIEPTATPEITATPEPSAEPTSTPAAGLPVGPFSIEPDGPFSATDSGITLTVTIPAPGWGFDPTWNLLGGRGDADPFVAFWAFPGEEFYVPADPCRGDSTRPDTPATTVGEIAAALAAQASRDASEPVDVTIGGYAGKSLTLHAPEGVNESECEAGGFVTYFTSINPDLDTDGFYRNTQRPDEVSELWILDVDGTTVIIDAVSSPDTPVELVEEIRGVVESTTFELP